MDYPMVEHMGYNRYEHAQALHRHAHEGFEFVFVIDGELTYEGEHDEVFSIKGGEYLFMHPGVMHHPVGGFESPCHFIWLIFDPADGKNSDFTPFTQSELSTLRGQLGACTSSIHSFGAETLNSLQRFQTAVDSFRTEQKQSGVLALLRSVTTELIVDGVNQLHQVEDRDSTYGQAAIAFIEANLFEPIAVADVAEHLGFSESRTYTLFRAFTGQSPVDYLLRLRIRAAEGMLQNSDSSVSDIAFRCGFNSSQYFARVFRKYTGVTPTEFRRKTIISK